MLKTSLREFQFLALKPLKPLLPLLHDWNSNTLRLPLTRRHVLGLLCGSPAIVAGFRCLQGESASVNSDRKVIITSDDAGMCRAVNVGMIRAMRQGLVSSASMMTCCPAFDEFAEFAVDHPQFDYGVHLVLTCDLREQPWGPILGKEAVPSLVDEDGIFPFWPDRNLKIEEVHQELQAQINRAKQAGIPISHIDHHMWVMFQSPELLRLYVQLGIEFNLPIRFCRTPPARVARNPELLQVYREQLKILDSKGFPVLDFIESANYSIAPDKKREYFLQQLRNLPVGVSEIAAHCSVVDSTINPPDVEKRAADLEFFTSLEAKEECRRSRLIKTDWGNL